MNRVNTILATLVIGMCLMASASGCRRAGHSEADPEGTDDSTGLFTSDDTAFGDTGTGSESSPDTHAVMPDDTASVLDSDSDSHPLDTADTVTWWQDIECRKYSDEGIGYAPFDGIDKSCRYDCWQGAALSACCPSLEDCLADESCRAQYRCVEDNCCNQEGDYPCGTQEQFEACLQVCQTANDVNDDAMTLHEDFLKCVLCDACEESCNEPTFDGLCHSPDFNTPETPCHDYQAETDVQSCFTWAISSGPCSIVASNCYNAAECISLEQCIDDTWQWDDWAARQDLCFDAASVDTVENYWAYMQCVYCDVCDVACKQDAGEKRCDSYTSTDN